MDGYLTADAHSSIKSMTERYGIQFMEYMDSEICDNPDNFEDSLHLNDKGARSFTEDFVSRI